MSAPAPCVPRRRRSADAFGCHEVHLVDGRFPFAVSHRVSRGEHRRSVNANSLVSLVLVLGVTNVAHGALFFDGVLPDTSTWAVAAAYGLTTLALGTVWFVSVEDDLSEYL